ncbi:CBS domain-containing protein [Corynebacterium poyangense]|uniref:CBS domain-containing protein n=1 Tax=Corynebacterium poyangense TaxID=2684405 RepID=A0A7H0SNI3_9CORY|nr:DUF294 nucleotidyltransferase-like domain-containing protein [Corynebacterium poyangense]MBZ8177140.1 CBS domain-containing protein [Corynebacterium poyangense]QNQ90108.1 CBS domain-containing protein [Corynebacterium poyangense]
MSVEIEAVRDFIAEVEPFSRLPESVLNDVARHITMTYVPKGTEVVAYGHNNDQLFIIRTGAVDVLDEQGLLLDRRDAGGSFGYSSLMGEPNFRYQVITVEDSLLMILKESTFSELAQAHPEFERFYSSQSRRIAAEAEQLRQGPSNELLRTTISTFMVTNPLCIPATTSIQHAAVVMRDHDSSSLLVTASDGELRGILTDRDLRSRVLAAGHDPQQPVSTIMTSNLLTTSSTAPAFEVMLLMAEHGIHHMPVVDDGELRGILSSADVIRLLHQDPIYLTADLSRRTFEDMTDAYRDAVTLALRFIEKGSHPQDVAGLLTMVADSIARRLITLAEEELGPAPIPWAFVALGSQGRKEMGLASDQDNALILDNSYREDEHGEYFRRFTEMICQGLHRAGQILCPGDMMAQNPQWRMTLAQWQDTFHTWITAPQPEALLHAQIFFDLRGIAGDQHLVDSLHRDVVEMAQGASRLHAHLAALAARREPPLGFFRGFVVDRSGEYANTLDVKKGGIAAIVQMARLYALHAGSLSLSTRSRLQEAAAAGTLSDDSSRNLQDAFDVLSSLTLKHQADQVIAGHDPDYHLNPANLSKMDREHLRDSFQLIKNLQTALATKYPVRNI